MDLSQRKSTRATRDQLVTLVNGWDPAGRLVSGAPRDAYQSMVDKLLDLLSGKSSSEQIAAFLEREVHDQFSATPKDALQFAHKAIAWFDLASQEQA